MKAARAHAAVVKPAPNGGATVNFTIDRMFHYEGLVSAAGDVLGCGRCWTAGHRRHRWSGASPITRLRGVRFPARIERVIAGLPWYDLR